MFTLFGLWSQSVYSYNKMRNIADAWFHKAFWPYENERRPSIEPNTLANANDALNETTDVRWEAKAMESKENMPQYRNRGRM